VRTWAVLLGVAAIAVAAVVDAIRSDRTNAASPTAETDPSTEPEADELAGPHAPPGGALPGRLVVVTGEECRVQVVDLAGPTLGAEGPPTDCGLWLSPDGELAAVSRPWERGTPGPYAEIALVRLGDPPEHVRDVGLAAGEVSWSPDGSRIALCGTRSRTVVRDVAGTTESEIPGCEPRFVPDGSLLTSPARAFGDELLRDGQVELGPLDLLRGFDAAVTGDLDVLAYDETGDGLLAVSVVRLEPLGSRAVLELWQDGELSAAVELPRRFGVGSRRLGQYLRFSPTGDVLAVGPSAARDSMIFVDLRLRRPSLELDYQRAFAWSPDGQWLAVALEDEIVVYSTNSSEPVYRLPLAVSALGWTVGRGGERD
jgi:hypothetical protein